jgi:uncharacterized protein YozE (UPF0346 family)
MKIISFYTYMTKKYFKERSPKGDLARDMKYDTKDFPRNNSRNLKKGYEKIRDYLEMNNACEACMNVFEDSWEEYANNVNSN